MKSNIAFRSNVYPISENRSVFSDEAYKANIWNYERLYELYSRQRGIEWGETQRKILQEKPVCILNKEDPCWGMVVSDSGPTWICKCTKIDCKQMPKCRHDNPCTQKELETFSPIKDGYDRYQYDSITYSLAPLLFSQAEYLYDPSIIRTNSLEKNKQTEDDYTADELPEDVVVQDTIEPKEQTVKLYLCSEQEECVEESVDDNTIDENLEEPVKQSDEDNKLTVDNIFDCFEPCSQELIIEAGSNKSFFVDAGPGTGKTYTLINKINHLVTQESVDPEGIMVLCFTNAAVDEIRERFNEFINNGADRSLRNVDIRTFHSFAWWLIGQANNSFVDDGWTPVQMNTLSYDSSIKVASKLITDYSQDIFEGWEYFIVDEVQDLTGDLGRFVLGIVKACLERECGVTALGDACQAIYDYNSGEGLDSTVFYNSMFNLMSGKASFVSLTDNHRQTTELIAETEGLRKAILSKKIEKMISATEVLKQNVKKNTEESGDATTIGNDGKNGTVSILFRTNGKTLKYSSDLRKRGIPHALTLTDTKNHFAPWIADVFYDYRNEYISEEELKRGIKEYSTLNQDIAWKRIQKLLHTKDDKINVRELLDSIAVLRCDDSIFHVNENASRIVSNIHRSKGREYDVVIVDESFVDQLINSPVDEEAFRTLYVAITRPRRGLHIAPLSKRNELYYIKIFNTGRNRWGKMDGGRIKFLEFDSVHDIDVLSFSHVNQNAISLVSIGDEISLRRIIKGTHVCYEMYHDISEKTLGKINTRYIDDIRYRMSIKDSELIKMPAFIDDLYVSGVFSEVVDEKFLKEHPEIQETAPNGVWKWVEIVGVGHMNYDVY